MRLIATVRDESVEEATVAERADGCYQKETILFVPDLVNHS